MKQCQLCYTKNPSSAIFCQECGVLLDETFTGYEPYTAVDYRPQTTVDYEPETTPYKEPEPTFLEVPQYNTPHVDIFDALFNETSTPTNVDLNRPKQYRRISTDKPTDTRTLKQIQEDIDAGKTGQPISRSMDFHALREQMNREDDESIDISEVFTSVPYAEDASAFQERQAQPSAPPEEQHMGMGEKIVRWIVCFILVLLVRLFVYGLFD